MPRQSRRNVPIRVIHTTTFDVIEFDDKWPSTVCAIASHRWTSSELNSKRYSLIPRFLANQCSHMDVQQRIKAVDKRFDKQAFLKIQKLCEKARSLGIRHLWIDSCCIDSDNVQELSRSLKAMFDWYRGAQICWYICTTLLASLTALNGLQEAGLFRSCLRRLDTSSSTRIGNLWEISMKICQLSRRRQELPSASSVISD